MPVSRKRKKPAGAGAAGTAPQSPRSRRMLLPAAVAIAVAAAVGVYLWADGERSGGAHVEVQVPELSREATRGARLFAENCTQCHGANAAGSDRGPPLVHRIYEPNHHGDAAFYAGVRRGVRAHHWDYGNMPAVDGVDERQVGYIIRYVRELQQANGIF